MKIGDKIRSFDFKPIPGHPVNYMEGIIWKIDDTFIWFNPTVIVRDGCIADIGVDIEKKYKGTTRTVRPDLSDISEYKNYEGRISILTEAK